MTAAPNENDPIERLVEIAHEQLRWLRIAAIPIVKESLIELLATSKKRQVYEMCDGSHTFNEIVSSVGVSKGSVSGWTAAWRDAGLMYQDGNGRMHHLIGLQALGLSIEVPDQSADGSGS